MQRLNLHNEKTSYAMHCMHILCLSFLLLPPTEQITLRSTMKLSICSTSALAATLLGLSTLASASTSEPGQCVSGKGEFTFRGAIDAHFDLNACQEDAMNNIASGAVKSGQFNADSDTFHYDVHCMSVHPDGSTVFVGAEINELSKYVSTYQNQDSFYKSLIDGDRDYVLAYERKVYDHHAENPEYIAALTSFLNSKGHTLGSYEEGIGLHDDGNVRRHRRAKGQKKAKKDEIPLQVLACAKRFIEEPPVCEGGQGLDQDEISFDLSNLDLSSSDEEDLTQELFMLCAQIITSTCIYTSEFHDGFGNRRLEESSSDNQGTLALFQLNLDGDHSIAIKLGHDFNTTCVDFTETIDYGFFTEETVDSLTTGEFNLN